MLSALWLFGDSSVDDDNHTPSTAQTTRAISIHNTVTTDDCAERIRAGDHAAFSEFVEAHYERAVRVAWAVVRSRDAARDIAQEVFIRLWERRAELDASRLTVAYVLTAAHRRALDEIKRRQVRDRHEPAVQATLQERDDPAESDDNRSLYTAVQQALASLPDRWQLALRLRLYEELSVPEVATILGISANAAHQLLHRAMRELRQRVQATLPQEPSA